MVTFITGHLVEIFFGLVSAGALAFCKHLSKELKNYRVLLDKQEDQDLNEAIKV